jgi:energy-coupling factor transporter ATP-binding protein EcfA2
LEPEDRVVIQECCPEPIKSTYTIESVYTPEQEIAPNFALVETSLNLSPGLVAVVGGRGSGKTALLEILASAFPEGKKAVQASPGSFLKRIVGTEPNGWTGTVLKSRISFADGQAIDCLLGNPSQSTPPRDGAIANYLPQDRLDQITGDPIQLQDQIRELVFEQNADLRSSFQDAMIFLSSIDSKQHLICGELDTLRERAALIPDKDAAFRQLQGELADVTQRLTQMQTTTGEDSDLQEIVNRRNALSQDRTLLQGCLYNVSLAVKSAQQALASLQEVTADTLTSVNQNDEDTRLTVEQLAEAIKSVDSLLNQLNKLSTSRSTTLASISRQIDELDKQQEKYVGVQQQIVQLATRKSELAARVGAAENDLHQLQQIEQTEIPNKVDSLVAEFENALLQYGKLSLFFKSELEAMSTRWSGLLEGLRFHVSVKWDRAGVIGQCLDDVNKTRVSESQLEGYLGDLESDLQTDVADDNHISELCTPVQNLIHLVDGRFRKGVTLSGFLSHVLNTGAFSLWLEPALDGVSLAQLSMGGRAVVLLKIVLAQGDYPLILDQPEQGLDNSYVFGKLVPAIREAKRRRQIIIATHNANLVVNTDAEQVIMARCDGETISYSTGSLEDPGTRQQVATLLEGGMEAFRKREQRYELKFD